MLISCEFSFVFCLKLYFRRETRPLTGAKKKMQSSSDEKLASTFQAMLFFEAYKLWSGKYLCEYYNC